MVSQTLQVYMVIYSLLRVVCAKIVNITALASKEEAGSHQYNVSNLYYFHTALYPDSSIRE